MLEGSNGTNVGADQGSESKSLAVNQILVVALPVAGPLPVLLLRLVIVKAFLEY